MKEKMKAVLISHSKDVQVALKKSLKHFSQIELVGECSTMSDAKKCINLKLPYLVFIDLDLAKINSVVLLKKIKCSPKVICITSKRENAFHAFELNAADCVLNPINSNKIKNAIARISVSNQSPIDPIVASKFERFLPNKIILLNFDNKMNFITIKDINCIEAYGNYTKVFLLDGKLSITYKSIKNWEGILPEDIFMQIHRSTLVNLMNVQRIEKWTNDTGRLHLKAFDKPFEISRSYFSQIKRKYKM